MLFSGKGLDPLSVFLEYSTLICAAMFWRIAIRKVFFSDRFRPPVVFLGCEQDVQKIQQIIAPSDQSAGRIPLGNCFKIVAAADIRNVSCPPSTMGQGTPSKVPFTVLDSHEQVIDLARQYRTRQVLVSKTLADHLGADQIADLKHQGLHLCSEDAMVEAVLGRREPKNIDPQELIYSGNFQHSIRRLFKRLGDIVLASLLLVLLSPVLGTYAFILAIKNKGKVLQTQPCVGLHKKVFTRYLFDGPAQETNDSNLNTSLRQLPQLWNTLKGEMSLVGPCPIEPEQTEILSHELPLFDERHTVRPGLTGWARVNGKCDGSKEAYRYMLGYDLFYLKHMSMFLDIATMSRAMHLKRTNKKQYSFTTQQTFSQ
jgi:lipopolysaccharide/colanic/teichoic acid biosynthesis glycosyltransferase